MITSRDPKIFHTFTEPEKGLSSITRYLELRIFMRLKEKGIDMVDVGDSETKDLNDKKRYFGAQKTESSWFLI
jgi:hypothetical protein